MLLISSRNSSWMVGCDVSGRGKETATRRIRAGRGRGFGNPRGFAPAAHSRPGPFRQLRASAMRLRRTARLRRAWMQAEECDARVAKCAIGEVPLAAIASTAGDVVRETALVKTAVAADPRP